MHGPIYTLVLLSVVGSNSCSIYTCTFVCCGVNPWSDLHPVLVIKSMVPSCTCVLMSIVGSNSCSHLHPVLLAVVGSNPWSDLLPPCSCDQIHCPIYTQPVLVIKSMVSFTPCICVCCGVKSMVPFTPCTSVCCGFKSMVPFTPCTCVYCGVKSMIHGSIYTLYLCLF